MAKQNRLFQFCLAFFCLALTVQAQYRFDHWTEENGLPQNWVKGIRQTRDGYLWITTGQGAARFDGVRFKVFNRANTPNLLSDRFSLYAVFEDSRGNLWMGTEDGGVVVYRDGVFRAISSAQGLPGDSVLRIDEGADGTIWIFTTAGLASWKDGELKRVAPAPDSPFNDLLTAPKNLGKDAKSFGLWRADADGWQRFASGRWQSFPLPPRVKDLASLQISWIIEDTRGRIWYSLADRPGESYRVENDGQLTTSSGFGGNRSAYYEDNHGRFWLHDQNAQSALWDNGKITPLPDASASDFQQVFEDREGTVWFTTLSRGLYRLKRDVVSVYLHPGGSEYNNIQPLMLDGANNVWTGSGGLARFDDGRFENFYHAGLSRSPSFERNVLIALFEDFDGSFWLGVRDGIVRFRNNRLERDEQLSAQIKGWVHTIYRDRSGALWFGSEEGLYCLRDGNLTRYGKEDGLGSEHIRLIHEDRAGTLWIGTVAGLARRTEKGFYTLNEIDGVSPVRISALYEDARGFLWVGTYDGALYRLANDSGKIQVVRYATEQGLPYDAIHKILEDDQGFFWIGGQRGIYRIRRQELDNIAGGNPASVTVTRLGKEDGLLTPSCNSWGQPAGFKAPDGKLWFPTEEGIAVINPKDLPFNSTPPPVKIEEAIVDRQPVDTGSDLEINPSQESLEINYVALSFIKPEQMRFRYKLEGLDRDWIEAGSRRTAYYSHIPPGEYVFTVLAANSDGVWNETGASFAIVVKPPFYRHPLFVTACLVAFVGFVYGIYRIRVARIERARKTQEEFSRRLINAHEAERRRVAAELHDSIGQTLAMIKNRSVYGARTTESLAAAHEQLDAITQQTTQAIGEVREISYNLRPYLLENLGLTKAIKSLVNKIEEVHLLNVDTRIDDVDDLFSTEAEMSVYRIIQESLNNVAKHAEADEAALTIEKKNETITIIIADDGRGFDKNAAPQTDAARGGFGLLGIGERVRMLGGTLDIQTAIGKGAKLTIKIPLSGKIIKRKNG